MAKNNRNTRRYRDVEITRLFYNKKSRWLNTCIYCGQPATEWDHVLAVSLASQLDLNNPQIRKHLKHCLYTVPCCKECNAIANNELFYNILDKRKFIQNKLKIRYKKLLRSRLWSKEELEEVGYNFKTMILKSQNKRFEVERRIFYPAI